MSDSHINKNSTTNYCLNKCVFKDFLKMSGVEQVLISRGWMFQAFGATTENDILPYVFSLDAGILSRC